MTEMLGSTSKHSLALKENRFPQGFKNSRTPKVALLYGHNKNGQDCHYRAASVAAIKTKHTKTPRPNIWWLVLMNNWKAWSWQKWPLPKSNNYCTHRIMNSDHPKHLRRHLEP